MCLAVPGRIVRVWRDGPTAMADVDFAGTAREVNLVFVPDAVVGDHVVVHAGFGVRTVPAAEAAELSAWLDPDPPSACNS